MITGEFRSVSFVFCLYLSWGSLLGTKTGHDDMIPQCIMVHGATWSRPGAATVGHGLHLESDTVIRQAGRAQNM